MMKKGIIKSSILLCMMILFVSSRPKEEPPRDYSRFLEHYEDFINYCNQQQSHLIGLDLLAIENLDEDTQRGIDFLEHFVMLAQADVQNLYDIMYIYNLADPESRARSMGYVFDRIGSIHNNLYNSLLFMDSELEKYKSENQHTLSAEYSMYIRKLNKLIETVVRNKSEI